MLRRYYDSGSLAISQAVDQAKLAVPLRELAELPERAKVQLWPTRKFWEMGYENPTPRSNPGPPLPPLRQHHAAAAPQRTSSMTLTVPPAPAPAPAPAAPEPIAAAPASPRPPPPVVQRQNGQ
eukprot:SAG22_NODE_3973_length_1443_cov_1.001488_2_plen_123_part_00